MDPVTVKVLIAFLTFICVIITTIITYLLNKRKDLKPGSVEYDKNLKKTIYDMQRDLADLLDMHNVKDENGVPIWYVGSDLRNIAKTLARTLERMAATEEGMLDTLKKIEHNNTRITDKLLERV